MNIEDIVSSVELTRSEKTQKIIEHTFFVSKFNSYRIVSPEETVSVFYKDNEEIVTHLLSLYSEKAEIIIEIIFEKDDITILFSLFEKNLTLYGKQQQDAVTDSVHLSTKANKNTQISMVQLTNESFAKTRDRYLQKWISRHMYSFRDEYNKANKGIRDYLLGEQK